MVLLKIEIFYFFKFGKNECRLNNVYNVLFFSYIYDLMIFFYINLFVEYIVDIV